MQEVVIKRQNDDEGNAGEKQKHRALGVLRQLFVQGGDGNVQRLAEFRIFHALQEFRIFVQVFATVHAPESGCQQADNAGRHRDFQDIDETDGWLVLAAKGQEEVTAAATGLAVIPICAATLETAIGRSGRMRVRRATSAITGSSA